MASRILVTGFGAFPGVPVNPTEALIEGLAKRGVEGATLLRLRTDWASCETVAKLARRHRHVVMFGVAGRARRIRYERRASPFIDARPDASGLTGRTSVVAASRSRLTLTPVPRLVGLARRAGFPVVQSHDAGRYVCNASYGAALSANPRALFVHVPMPHELGRYGETILLRHALWLIGTLTGASYGALGGRV